MPDASGFVTPPPLTRDPADRLPVVWTGDPAQTPYALWVDHTKPIDSSVNVGIGDGKTHHVMPLTASRARQLAHELIIRADLIDPGTAGERFQVGDEVLWRWHEDGGSGRWFKARLVEHAPAGYPKGWSGDVTDRGTFYDSGDSNWDVPLGHNVFLDEPSMTLVHRPSKENPHG